MERLRPFDEYIVFDAGYRWLRVAVLALECSPAHHQACIAAIDRQRAELARTTCCEMMRALSTTCFRSVVSAIAFDCNIAVYPRYPSGVARDRNCLVCRFSGAGIA